MVRAKKTKAQEEDDGLTPEARALDTSSLKAPPPSADEESEAVAPEPTPEAFPEGQTIGDLTTFSERDMVPDLAGFENRTVLVNPSPQLGGVAGGDESGVTRWVVKTTKFPVQVRGQSVTLRAGKVLDARAYDIQALIDQGVELEVEG